MAIPYPLGARRPYARQALSSLLVLMERRFFRISVPTTRSMSRCQVAERADSAWPTSPFLDSFQPLDRSHAERHIGAKGSSEEHACVAAGVSRSEARLSSLYALFYQSRVRDLHGHTAYGHLAGDRELSLWDQLQYCPERRDRSGATTTTRKMTGSSGTLSYQIFQNSSRTTNWGNTSGSDEVTGTGTGSNQTINAYAQVLGTSMASRALTPIQFRALRGRSA